MVDDESVRWLADGLDSHSAAAVEEHCRQLDACLEEELYGSAVVALSAGFESILQEGLIEELDAHDDYLARERIRSIEGGHVQYVSVLEEALDRGVIDDDIHEILDGLRDERNSYVHSDSRAIARADVENDSDLEGAHDLYEQVLEETGPRERTGGMQRNPRCEKQRPVGRVRVTC
jgi:hypothetical protein